MSVQEEEQEQKTIDLEIEDSEVMGMDSIYNQLEMSLKRICISVIEQLAVRVPKVAVPLLESLIEALVSGGMREANLQTKDNIIMMIGLLPQVYSKISKTDGPNIDGFFAWFSEQSNLLSRQARSTPSSAAGTRCSSASGSSSCPRRPP
jgi:hypothetical protein